MNLVAHDSRQPIEICGYSISAPNCVIHFYYSPAERRRSISFLAEGIAEGDAVLLACPFDGYESLADALDSKGISRNDRRLIRIQILPDLAATVTTIAEALSTNARAQRRRARLLADFGSMVGAETIFALEALLSSALRGQQVVSFTQYDGRNFPAYVTIEQFHTHALTIIGNAMCTENRNYTPPEKYIQKHAATAKA